MMCESTVITDAISRDEDKLIDVHIRKDTKREGETQYTQGERHVTTEVQTTMTQLQTKGHRGCQQHQKNGTDSP